MTDVQPQVGSIASSHYTESYFQWQNRDAELGAELNKWKFIGFLKREHRCILDFGCGGGWLLNCIEADTKIGIEINPAAQEHARALGIEVHADISEVPSQSVDLIISDHALEHVERPFEVMQNMNRVLREDGVIIIVVPCDRANYTFNENDQDLHLYSWSAGTLGNLAKVAGFSVIDASELVHRWPPKWAVLRRALGPKAFDIVCRAYGAIRRDRTQVRLVARR